jgi:hypothetical protein
MRYEQVLKDHGMAAEHKEVPVEIDNQVKKFRERMERLKNNEKIEVGNLSEVNVQSLNFKELKIFTEYELLCKKFITDLSEETSDKTIIEFKAAAVRLAQPVNTAFGGFIINRLSPIVGYADLWFDSSKEDKNKMVDELKSLLNDFE